MSTITSIMVHTAILCGPHLKKWSRIVTFIIVSESLRITSRRFIVISFFSFDVLKMPFNIFLSDHWNVAFVQWSIFFFI